MGWGFAIMSAAQRAGHYIRAARRRPAALAAGAALALAAGSAAGAGDLYLRLGAGLDRPAGTAFADRDCSPPSGQALYGCGRGADGAPYRTVGGFGTAAVLEAGLGWAVRPRVRLEALVEYRPRLAFEGRANFLAPGRRQEVAARLSTLSAMGAVYLGLAPSGLLRPFVGAGAGLVRTRTGDVRMTFPATTTIVPGAGRTGFAWMATAGVAVPLGARTALDLSWRYSDLGEAHTGTGGGRVVWRDGSRPARPLDLAPTRARLRSHGLRAALRYTF